MQWGYPIIITKDDNGTYLVTCSLLPDMVTFGIDEEDARIKAVSAITTIFEARIADGEHVPSPVEYKGKWAEARWIQLSESITIKAYLHNLELTAQRSK